MITPKIEPVTVAALEKSADNSIFDKKLKQFHERGAETAEQAN